MPGGSGAFVAGAHYAGGGASPTGGISEVVLDEAMGKISKLTAEPSKGRGDEVVTEAGARGPENLVEGWQGREKVKKRFEWERFATPSNRLARDGPRFRRD